MNNPHDLKMAKKKKQLYIITAVGGVYYPLYGPYTTTTAAREAMTKAIANADQGAKAKNG